VPRDNLVLLTYDSCRYDVLMQARTPVLDSFATVRRASTPATFTYAAHQAFFAGILPNCDEPIPYYNRFVKQLIGIAEVGEVRVVKDALHTVATDGTLVEGLADSGYATLGTGAMNWFRQAPLQRGFQQFQFTGTNAERQVAWLVERLPAGRPFFAFANFGETHAPYRFRGKRGVCPVDVWARRMTWPPVQTGRVGRECPAFEHQVAAAEFLDRQLGVLLSALPPQTIVVVCADHGECFGEDGYWGHGVDHPKVHEVPLAIFALDGRELS
jgi:membrane-anchored protein YejM (alkaline phosphatase superfamily)